MLTDKTALVLGGGGILGAAEVGFIQRIEELGIGIDMVVGTSVGAINAAFLATHDAPAAGRLRDAWSGLAGKRLYSHQPLGVAWHLVRSRMSLYDDSFVRSLVTENMGTLDFAKTRIPLYVTATDICSGRRHVFREGSILTAVLASTAIPGLFPPVPFGAGLFVDGAVSASVDIAAAVELGATTVIALDLRSAAVSRRPTNIVELLSRSWQVIAENRASRSTEDQSNPANVIHIQPGLVANDRRGFGDADRLMDESYEIARSIFDQCWDGQNLHGGHFHPAPRLRPPAPSHRRRLSLADIPTNAWRRDLQSLLEQRVPTKVLSERLGHTRTAITRELYQHVTPTDAGRGGARLRKLALEREAKARLGDV
jgi:NTE family protein